jgi:tRNA pseudouridine13 synthase
MSSMNGEYRLKHLNSDFRVSEVPMTPKLCDERVAKYTVIELRKNNVNPFEAIQCLAEILQISPNAITYSGMKDRSGITTQQITIQGKYNQRVLDAVKQRTSGAVQVRNIGYTEKPLQIGRLYGNNFSIILRDIDNSHRNSLEKLNNKAIISPTVNYYDLQRFGLRGILNSHIIGEHIYTGEWDKAVAEFLKSGNQQIEKNEIKRLIHLGKSNKEAFSANQDMRKQAFFLGAKTSFDWNEEVKDVLIDEQNPANIFKFQNGPMSLNFLRNPKLINNGTFSHPYHYFVAKNSDDFEERIAQRPIIQNNKIEVSQVSDDEIFKGKLKTQLDFFLRGGSYATMAVKQFMSRVLEKEVNSK